MKDNTTKKTCTCGCGRFRRGPLGLRICTACGKELNRKTS